jgi:hypothetical protein
MEKGKKRGLKPRNLNIRGYPSPPLEGARLSAPLTPIFCKNFSIDLS